MVFSRLVLCFGFVSLLSFVAWAEDCYEYYGNSTCDDYYSEEMADSDPGCTGCVAAQGRQLCMSAFYQEWQDSTSEIAEYGGAPCGYAISYLGAHACRIYYECPLDCDETTPNNFKCQDSFMVRMDKIDVYTQGAVCEEPGYGCS